MHAALLRRLRSPDLLRLTESLITELGPERVHHLASTLNLSLTTEETPSASSQSPPKKRLKPQRRAFDFHSFPTRKIALWIAYWGGAYRGFAANASSSSKEGNEDGSVEAVLFQALTKTRLVDEEAGRGGTAWGYSRCGRTDRGVSAFGQVVAVRVRSHRQGERELDYLTMINKCLPRDVAVLAWADVGEEFDARFMCEARTYRYAFVPREEMDVNRMTKGAKLFLGTHDFRNFCKMDVESAAHFIRTIEKIDVVVDGPNKAYVEVTGNSFLWHQVRMMMGVLFLVARGLEEPEVISRLLDPVAFPRRPCYEMASEEPLVLYSARYREPLIWIPAPKDILTRTRTITQRRWTDFVRNTTTCEMFLDTLETHPLMVDSSKLESDHVEACLGGEFGVAHKKKAYKPLLTRQGGNTFEERVEALPEEKRVIVLARAARANEYFKELKSNNPTALSPRDLESDS